MLRQAQHERNGIQRWGRSPALGFFLGAALSLAFAPFDIWPLSILCLAWLFYVWRDATPRRAAKLGFWFTAGTFLAGTYWLYHSVYVIGQAPLPIAILLMLGLVAIMGAYTALLAYIQARWLPKHDAWRYLGVLPAMWVLVEWLRGWLFTGFPWLAVGYTTLDTPLSGFAPVVGVYGLSVLVAVMSGALALFVISIQQRRSRTYAFSLVVLLAPGLIGYSLKQQEWTRPIDQPISVAIVQGAVPQQMKWSKEQHDATLNLYRDMTLPLLGTQLIIWPESALPDWAESLTDYLSNLWQLADGSGSSVVLGLQRYDAQTDAAYNGLLALSYGSSTPQWYYKHHLVPFGEFFPVPATVRAWMRLMSLPHSDFASGPADQPPLAAAGQKLGASICYEDAYGSSQLSALKEATLLVNVTNDAWFGDSTAKHQHLQISRMRALEAGRDLIRAANDGVTAFIAYDGRIVSQLPQFKAAVLKGSVQPRTGLTPYARTGNWPAISLCILLLLAALAASRIIARQASRT
jgi:apolipoprotein N-acyltransferase